MDSKNFCARMYYGLKRAISARARKKSAASIGDILNCDLSVSTSHNILHPVPCKKNESSFMSRAMLFWALFVFGWL